MVLERADKGIELKYRQRRKLLEEEERIQKLKAKYGKKYRMHMHEFTKNQV